MGYRNTDIDPHFKFKFVVAPVGILERTRPDTEACILAGYKILK